jgi:hypothetical protein
MKVKDYFDIFLTNPHIGCMRRKFCFRSTRISEITDKVHHGNAPVVPLTIIRCLKCMTVVRQARPKRVINERRNKDKRAAVGRDLDPA